MIINFDVRTYKGDMASSSQAQEPLLGHTNDTDAAEASPGELRNDPRDELIKDLRHEYKSLKYFTYSLTIFYGILIIVYIILVREILQPCHRVGNPPHIGEAQTGQTSNLRTRPSPHSS